MNRWTPEQINAIADEWETLKAAFVPLQEKITAIIEATGVEYIPGNFAPRDDQPELQRAVELIAEAPWRNPMTERRANRNMSLCRREIADLKRINRELNKILAVTTAL